MDKIAKEFVMYIFINHSLNMQKGKIASQVGHVVQTIVEEIIRSAYETRRMPESYTAYMKWKKDGSKKIVLKATEKELKELIGMENSRYIIDAGRTQVEPNSLTVVGFFPSDQLSEKFKEYKLL